jgi:excisionase family DNA binding protein
MFIVKHDLSLAEKGGQIMADNYISTQELGRRLDLSPSTVYRMIRSGQIPAQKFGRKWKISERIFNQLEEPLHSPLYKR